MHSDIINRIAQIGRAESYLEIGVSKGKTFHEVRAARKVAVDPHFKFDIAARSGKPETYFLMPSDEFFRQETPQPFDVIFLDGLHTYEQTLRDLINSLRVSHAKTVWIIDDTVPSDGFAALPDQERCYRLRQRVTGSDDRAWMGDVYKVVYFVRAMMPAYRFWTLAGSHQTVLWQETPVHRDAGISLERIGAMTYEDFCDRPELMNFTTMAEVFADLDRFMRS